MSTTMPKGIKSIIVIILLALLAGGAAFGFFVAGPMSNTNYRPGSPSYRDGAPKGGATSSSESSQAQSKDAAHTAPQGGQATSQRASEPHTQHATTATTDTPQPKSQPQARPDTRPQYTVKAIDRATGKVIASTTHRAEEGATVTVTAEDLFAQGYELFDTTTKQFTATRQAPTEIAFAYGKSRELMSLTEFTRHEVDYKHPLRYRNLDFTGRQAELEEFVIKMIYQGEKSTGQFYGTKDQADKIRQTLLNGSFQGAYARYATNFIPATPRHIKGDTYAHEISFHYWEHREDMALGEAKITEFVSKYGTDYTDAEKAKLIHDWLMKNGKLFDPPHTRQEWFYNTKNIRRVHFPASLMLDGEGVCLTYAMTYGRLAERMGLEVRLIQGYNGLNSPDRAVKAQEMFDNPDSTTYHPGFLNHTWNIVKIDRAWHHIDTFQDKVLLQFTKKNPDPYHHFLKEEDFFREHKVKMGTNRLREYTVNRAWNTHRIPAAPTAKNEFKVMRDRSQLDIKP